MSSVKQFQVTFDCAQPERVARFWCEVLGYVIPSPPEEFATWDAFNRSLPPEEQDSWFACGDPAGVGPRLYFPRVPEGKVAKNRFHLDIRVGTGLVGDERLAMLEAECARLLALGATHSPPGRRGERVLHSDAGHRRQRVLSRLISWRSDDRPGVAAADQRRQPVLGRAGAAAARWRSGRAPGRRTSPARPGGRSRSAPG